MYDELRNCSLANPLQLSQTFEDIQSGKNMQKFISYSCTEKGNRSMSWGKC
jgi:hypothetical protein